jgi:hypothetical protein
METMDPRSHDGRGTAVTGKVWNVNCTSSCQNFKEDTFQSWAAYTQDNSEIFLAFLKTAEMQANYVPQHDTLPHGDFFLFF